MTPTTKPVPPPVCPGCAVGCRGCLESCGCGRLLTWQLGERIARCVCGVEHALPVALCLHCGVPGPGHAAALTFPSEAARANAREAQDGTAGQL